MGVRYWTSGTHYPYLVSRIYSRALVFDDNESILQIPQEVPGILASLSYAALSSKAVPVSLPSKL